MNAPHDLLPPRAARRPVPAAMLDALKARFGERCSTATSVREQHGRGESVYDAQAPDAVLFCESSDEVAFAVQQAAMHAVPVIPFGVGSSKPRLRESDPLDLTRRDPLRRRAHFVHGELDARRTAVDREDRGGRWCHESQPTPERLTAVKNGSWRVPQRVD
mgnify:CR=1 FL=1